MWKARHGGTVTNQTKCRECLHHCKECDDIAKYENERFSADRNYSRTPHLKWDTLCWCCANVYSGCEWSANRKAVEGWDAEKDSIEGRISYRVKRCPKFVRDTSKLKGEEK